jgi:uncharacterized membrane protein (DUF106 family)
MHYNKFKITVLSITILAIIISVISGCERNLVVENNLKDQLEESKVEVEQLKQKIKKLELENKNFNKIVGELSVQGPNGLKMEERRKALVEKETNLKIKEDGLLKNELLISEREKSIRKEEKKMLIEHDQFINKKQKEFRSIGEAEEMKRNYKKLQEDKDKAENRANNWLIWLSILGLIVFITIIGVVILSMRIKEKGRQVINTFKMLNSINLSTEDKKLLTSSLGQFE